MPVSTHRRRDRIRQLAGGSIQPGLRQIADDQAEREEEYSRRRGSRVTPSLSGEDAYGYSQTIGIAECPQSHCRLLFTREITMNWKQTAVRLVSKSSTLQNTSTYFHQGNI